MFAIQHLQRQRDESQAIYEIFSKKIVALRMKQAIETDPSELFKLDTQLNEAIEKRDKLVQEIENLDQQISALDQTSNLYTALLALNYEKQQVLFKQLTTKQVGAFIIHGEPDYGQSWLLNRLIRQVPKIIVGKVISINLMSRARRWDLDAIMRELKRFAGLTIMDSPMDLINQIHEWWQTQSVVIILHHLDALDPLHAQKFIQDFWRPLVDKALTAPSGSPHCKLLMFLVDYIGCIDDGHLTCAEALDDSWLPNTPIKPPRLAAFDIDALASWLKIESLRLPAQLLSVQATDIFSRCQQGTPERVLEHICELCGCDWYEREHEWITY